MDELEKRLARLRTFNASVHSDDPTLGTEARKWIDDAVEQAGKRPDLAGNMDALQRAQQELDTVLTKKGLPRS